MIENIIKYVLKLLLNEKNFRKTQGFPEVKFQ
jgi:hypothetical protein